MKRLNKTQAEELREAIHDHRIFASQLSNTVFNLAQKLSDESNDYASSKQLVKDFDAAESRLLDKLKNAGLWKARG